MNKLKHNLKTIKAILALFIFSFSVIESKAQDNDSKHPKVYKINLSNKFIDPNGTLILYPTSNKQIHTGKCYEFYNNKVYTTSLVNVSTTKEGSTRIYYRHEKGSNNFSQLIYRGDNLPDITSFELSVNKVIEHAAYGSIFRLYRDGEFAKLISIKDLNGRIIFNIL